MKYFLDCMANIRRPEYDTLNIYTFPATLDEWIERLRYSGRATDGRLAHGIGELTMLAACGGAHPDIDIAIVNGKDALPQAAERVTESIACVLQ